MASFVISVQTYEHAATKSVCTLTSAMPGTLEIGSTHAQAL